MQSYTEEKKSWKLRATGKMYKFRRMKRNENGKFLGPVEAVVTGSLSDEIITRSEAFKYGAYWLVPTSLPLLPGCILTFTYDLSSQITSGKFSCILITKVHQNITPGY